VKRVAIGRLPVRRRHYAQEIDMKHLGALSVLALATTLLPSVAQAQAAYTAREVHLRAGPAREYLSIAVLPAGFEISVQGCLGDYSWCDVIAGADRGWVYAANISYPYQNEYVPVINYGAIIGIAVIGFIISDYWPQYYRDRPWYTDHYPPPPRRYRPPSPPLPMPGTRPLPPPAPASGGPMTRSPSPSAPGPDANRSPTSPHTRPVAPRAPEPQRGTPGGQRARPPEGRDRGDQRGR
jgi:uncharacterized protein YraI